MCVPMMAKGRTPTPAEGGATARRKQWKLKMNLLSRDGWFSPLGRVTDSSAPDNITPIDTTGLIHFKRRKSRLVPVEI
ncbi:hypothetical protein V1506DRAFT_219652 [Lipomyces tetrasporus]